MLGAQVRSIVFIYISSIQNENTIQIYGYASVVSGMVNIWCITLLSVERLWVIYWASRVRMVKVGLYCPCSSKLSTASVPHYLR